MPKIFIVCCLFYFFIFFILKLMHYGLLFFVCNDQ